MSTKFPKEAQALAAAKLAPPECWQAVGVVSIVEDGVSTVGFEFPCSVDGAPFGLLLSVDEEKRSRKDVYLECGDQGDGGYDHIDRVELVEGEVQFHLREPLRGTTRVFIDCSSLNKAAVAETVQTIKEWLAFDPQAHRPGKG